MDMTNSIMSYLPPGDGLLPKWLLFLAVVSLGNSVQAYTSLYPTQQVYLGPATPASSAKPKAVPSGVPASTVRTQSASPVTPLSARTFGTWTALASIVRLYAAYNIHDPVMYKLTLWTFGFAFAHFLSEWLVFGTARWGRGLAGPVIISTISGVWMLAQWSTYIQ